VTPEGTTLCISGFGVLAELNNPGATSAKWTDYVSVGDDRVGMRVNASGTLTLLFFKTDHLGSISVLTSGGGGVVQNLSYDAWGKRRNPNGTDDTTNSITSQATRGFTGEEELSVAGLIDPILARFTSADPTVTDPLNSQGWNRYSYVGNDPLTFTDPNGFDFFGDFFGAIGNFFSDVFNVVSNAVNSVVNFIASNPIARAIAQIGATLAISAILGPGGALASLGLNAGGIAAVSAFGGAAIATGLSGGNLGQVLKSGLIAGATAFAFAGLGSVTATPPGAGFNPGNYAANLAGSAAIGCVSSVASGGSCGSGAAAAAAGSALSPITNSVFPQAQSDLGERIGGTLVQATAGGLASVAGGGKFANGAVTGAFQYLATLSLEDARRNAYDQAGNGGAPPNTGHELGVQEAIRDASSQGYFIYNGAPTPVTLPGLPTRVYDFVVLDPATFQQIGVEVKTSWLDTIFLNRQQVNFDVQVAQGALGPAVGLTLTGRSCFSHRRRVPYLLLSVRFRSRSTTIGHARYRIACQRRSDLPWETATMSEISRPPEDPATFRLVGKECGASLVHAGWAKTQVFRIAGIESIDARQRDRLVRKRGTLGGRTPEIAG